MRFSRDTPDGRNGRRAVAGAAGGAAGAIAGEPVPPAPDPTVTGTSGKNILVIPQSSPDAGVGDITSAAGSAGVALVEGGTGTGVMRRFGGGPCGDVGAIDGP